MLKRTIWKDRYEIIYVGANQILVKPMGTLGRETTIMSNYGGEIEDVRVMGKDNYLVARTPSSLIVSDLQRNLISEVIKLYLLKFLHAIKKSTAGFLG